MDINVLKQVISEQRRELEEKFKREAIIERNNKDYVSKFVKYPNILAVLGVRRSGKSTFSQILSKNMNLNTAYINFDDERLISVKTEDLNNILQAFYELYGNVEVIILDELQNINGWELFVNRLRNTKRVIITGSNSKMLSGELATHLTGRYIDFTLYPFSFKELMRFKPDMYLTEHLARVKVELSNYVQGSGFPEFRKFGSAIIIRIYEDIINKDCIKRYGIRNEKTFKEVTNYLVSNFSNEFTYSKLRKVFGIKDVHTVKNYVEYLKEAFLIIILERFSPKLKQQVIAPKKVYNIDQGFCNFISFRLSKDIGKLIENIVCVELFRKKSINQGLEIYYWNSLQVEVDFVIKEKQKIKQLIQVCYDLSNTGTKEREIKSLLKASKELKCNDLLIITDNLETEEIVENKRIKYVPLWKWLL